MKKSIFIILAAIPFGLFAQEFAPIGAIWHNSQSSWIIPDIITYKTIESVSDTTINGKPCKKLIEAERLYSDTVFTINHFMYSENDSVLFFKDNEINVSDLRAGLYILELRTDSKVIVTKFVRT
jgi:hypothetical protein